MTGGERLLLVLQPSWDCGAIYKESRGRNVAGGGGRSSDLQITHGKKQIGLI